MSQSLSPLLRQLASQDIGVLQVAAPLARYSTWQIGGPADLLVEPSSVAQIQTVIRYAHQHGIALLVIGQGSNLLFADAGLRGIVLRLGPRFAGLHGVGNQLVAAAGVWVPHLARVAQQRGLSGLEHIVGIPGTVGGLVVMNGGSQRKGIGENVTRVRVVEQSGALRTLTPAECAFAYRHSALQESGSIVVEVELDCPSGDPATIRRTMLADLRERRRKFPLKLPNCGSVFLSTATMHASVGPPGRIIEEAGLKGLRVGNAEVSRQHANFIINSGGASAGDVLALIDRIRDVVRERIGFDLCCEVRYVAPDGSLSPAHLACPTSP